MRYVPVADLSTSLYDYRCLFFQAPVVQASQQYVAQKTKAPITLLNTSSSTIDKSVETLAGWINLHLKT